MPTPLRLVPRKPSPRTFGDGFIAGHEDGYHQGRRDRGIELLIIGACAGALFIAALLLAFAK